MQRETVGENERWRARHAFDAIGVHGYWFEVKGGGKTFLYQTTATRSTGRAKRAATALGRIEEDSDQHAWHPPFPPHSFRPGIQRLHGRKTRSTTTSFRTVSAMATMPMTRSRARPLSETRCRVSQESWPTGPTNPAAGRWSGRGVQQRFFRWRPCWIIDKAWLHPGPRRQHDLHDAGVPAASKQYDTADYRNIDPASEQTKNLSVSRREAGEARHPRDSGRLLQPHRQRLIYFDRFGNFGGKGAHSPNGRINKDSPYASWFTFDATQPDPDKQYRGWVDVKDLPELNKMSPGWRATFAYAKPDGVTQLGWRRARRDGAWTSRPGCRTILARMAKAVKAVNRRRSRSRKPGFDASKHFERGHVSIRP